MNNAPSLACVCRCSVIHALGVGLREDGLPDIAWCKVTPGEVTLEEDAGSFTVDAPFYIAKYPVTYVQYRAFLDAKDGYRNPQWWKGLWFQVDQPGRQFNRRDNHPAENLCWLEAVAFCNWLSERLGYRIQLPTECQWQQAATAGDPDREYPWPGGWDPDYANTYESQLSRSTAVGLYPQGASSVESLDMAGNVWEWCLNEYDDASQVQLSGDARRVLRGGSWGDGRSGARAAYRRGFGPFSRGLGVGFRLACLAHIFGLLQRRGLASVFPPSALRVRPPSSVRAALPVLAVDHGLRPEAKGLRWLR